MTCWNFQDTYFREHILMAAFIRFGSICFSEHFKVAAALFIKQTSILFFFSKYFYLKNHPKSMYLRSHFHDKRTFHHCFPSCFHGYFLRQQSSKTFLYWQNSKILISLTLFRGQELYLPPRSHCVKSVQIRSNFWSAFFRIGTEYGEILRIQSKCGKIRTRNYSVFGNFYAVSISGNI